MKTKSGEKRVAILTQIVTMLRVLKAAVMVEILIASVKRMKTQAMMIISDVKMPKKTRLQRPANSPSSMKLKRRRRRLM